jgi:alanine racemase
MAVKSLCPQMSNGSCCWRATNACQRAGIGTPVELWGKEIKIDDVAAAAGTVGYELMCALALRVPVVTV